MRVSKLRSSFAVWLATGIITVGISVLIHHRLYYRTIPNRLLANIKAGFANRGTIENSWIAMYPITIETPGQHHVRVYTGGLTIRHHRTRQQFEFAVQPDGHLWRLHQLHLVEN
ncbi:small secreted protein [Lacticaseibacillus zeae DSM 20178 = KCTC 3804]|uniref:Small secreted protein n=1 Tax=Lacticaseibacillus zeae DSM 20178 = KCTC 3804 TaxID=1423816 RepID=A0A0R1F3E2_LACZE|nr:hypothetical protein [Lacticaseibacillus zeae]KRK13460.1 small secreted protein [Lacticaseibacillus zeae DSM 20178 = KCTC 3804]OLS11324.1 small secreted protein [Lacticaseibacillus casei]QVI30930.1 hypothetical protein KG087_08220 [Lacticaseibacillus zeae]